MIRRVHVVNDFFEEAERMREALEVRFKDTYADRIPWYYFCDPRMYAYLRTAPQVAFSKEMFESFMKRLRRWCMENLGLAPTNLPYLNLMVNGCRLGLHSDFHNGVWGYVYSLTRWESRRFSGGETLLLRDGIPSYKKHHVQGDFLYELIPAKFNQLLVFDDRIVHGTPTIEGSMDPLDGRIAMVGHIRATSPVVIGTLRDEEVRRVYLEALPHLRERIRGYKDVQGTATYKLAVTSAGAVESVMVLTDNVVTPATGYERSETVMAVREVIQDTMAKLIFPTASGASSVTVPVLVPIPDLTPIEFSVSHALSSEAVREWAMSHLQAIDELGFQGDWNGSTYLAREPIAGRIEVEHRRINFCFDPPMWVPSQRERFQVGLEKWAKAASTWAEH